MFFPCTVTSRAFSVVLPLWGRCLSAERRFVYFRLFVALIYRIIEQRRQATRSPPGVPKRRSVKFNIRSDFKNQSVNKIETVGGLLRSCDENTHPTSTPAANVMLNVDPPAGVGSGAWKPISCYRTLFWNR